MHDDRSIDRAEEKGCLYLFVPTADKDNCFCVNDDASIGKVQKSQQCHNIRANIVRDC